MNEFETEKEANIAEIRQMASELNLDDKGVACLMAIVDYGVDNMPSDFIRDLKNRIEWAYEAAKRHEYKPRMVEL